MAHYRYTQVTLVPKKPDTSAGWGVAALIAAGIGGAAGGWGGAAIGFVIICLLCGLCEAAK